MRLQEQRTPQISFVHLAQQEQLVRNNLVYPSQANPRMIEQIESAKRKLNNSSSTAIFRNNSLFNPTENNRNLVNVQQRPNRSNHFYPNQPTPNISQSQLIRKNGPEVPEEDSEQTVKIRRQLTDTRKQNEGLKQVIAQNDASARFAIKQLQIALDTVKSQNQRIKSNYELLSKQVHDERNYRSPNQGDQSCSKCPRLQNRIKDLEAQIAELNQQLDRQQSKRTEMSQSNSLFRTELSQRLRNMEEKFLRSNEQVLKYESTIHELSRRVSQQQQKEFFMQEQTESLNQQLINTLDQKEKMALSIQQLKKQNQFLKTEAESIEQRHNYAIHQMDYFTNKIQAINADISGSERRGKSQDLGANLGELEERLGDLKYRLEQKIGENREYEQRMNEKDAYLKRISEEYSQTLEKLQQAEEAASYYRQRQEELQSQLDRTRSIQSPTNIERNELLIRNQQLQQAFHEQQLKNNGLLQEIYRKEYQISILADRLQDSNGYTKQISDQSQRNIRKLRQQILTLQDQNIAISSKSRQVQMQLSDVNHQLTQLKTYRFTAQRQIQQLVDQKQYIRNRVEELEQREKTANKNLNEYKQNSELQSDVAALQTEIQRLKGLINSVQQQKQNIEYSLLSVQRQNDRLRQQILLEESKSSLHQQTLSQQNTLIQNIQIELRQYEQNNRRLTKQNQSLKIQNKEYYNHLGEAESHIANLTEQIAQLDNTTLKQMVEQKIIENKQIENILEEELRSKRALETQAKELKEELDYVGRKATQYQILLEEANTSISRLQQTHHTHKTQLQGRLLEAQKKLIQAQNNKLFQPQAPQSNVELNNLVVKNEELFSHLTNAQNYIVALQQRIQQTSQEQQTLRNLLSSQIEKKEQIQRSLLSKQSELQQLNQQLLSLQAAKSQPRNEQNTIQNLKNNILAQQAEIKRLNTQITKQKETITLLDEMARQSSDLKKALAQERTIRETIEYQLLNKQSEQKQLRQALQQQKLNRESSQNGLIEQINRLQGLISKINQSQETGANKFQEMLTQQKQQRQKSQQINLTLQIQIKRLSSQLTRASTDRDSILRQSQQQLNAKQREIQRLSGECERLSGEYERVSRQFQRLSAENARISQQLQFNVGDRNKDLTTYERQSVDFSERENISAQQQRMREFFEENQQLRHRISELSQYLQAKEHQILVLSNTIQNYQMGPSKQSQSIVEELQKSNAQSQNMIHSLNQQKLQIRESNEEVLNLLRLAEDEIERLQQHLHIIEEKEVEIKELEASRRILISQNEQANKKIIKLMQESQKQKKQKQQGISKGTFSQQSLTQQNQNLKSLLGLAQRDIERLRQNLEQKAPQKQVVPLETFNKVLEQAKNQSIIAEKATKDLNELRNHQSILLVQINDLNIHFANSQNGRLRLQQQNQQLHRQTITGNEGGLQQINRLKQENLWLRGQLENAEQQIGRLSGLHQQLLDELGNKQAQLVNLYNQPPRQRIQYIEKPMKDNRQVQFQALNRQLLNLQQQNTSLKINVQQLTSQLQSLKPSNPKFNDKSLQSLIKSNQQKLSHINELTNRLISLEQKTITGEKEKQLLKSQLQNKNTHFEDLNSKIGVIVDQCQAKLSKLQLQLQEQRIKHNKYKADKEREIKELTQDNTGLKNRIQEQLNKNKSSASNSQEERTKLIEQKQFFRNKLIQAEDYIHSMQTHHSKLSQNVNNQLAQQIKTLTQKLALQSTNNSHLSQQNRKLIDSVSQQKQRIELLQSQNKQLGSEQQVLQNNLIEAERYIESIQSNILPEKDRLLESLQQDLHHKDSVIQNLRRQIERIREQFMLEKKKKQEGNANVIQPQNNKNELQAVKRQLNNQQQSLFKAEREIENLQQQLQQLSVHCNQLEQQVNAKDQKMESLEGDSNTKQQLKKALQAIKNLQLTHQNDQSYIRQLKQQEIPHLQFTVTSLIAQLQQANTNLNQIQLNNQNAENNYKQAELVCQRLQKEVNELQSELQTSRKNANDVSQKAHNQIRKLARELQDIKSRYQNSVNETIALKREREEQLLKLDEHLRLVEKQLQKAASQTQFFKNKLTEAEDFITYQAEIIAARDIELRKKTIQDSLSVISSQEIQPHDDILLNQQRVKNLEETLRTFEQQYAHLKSLFSEKDDQIGSLQSQRNTLLAKIQEQSTLLASLQANVQAYSNKIEQVQKEMRSQASQQKKDTDEQAQKLKQQLAIVQSKIHSAQERLFQEQGEKEVALKNAQMANKIKDEILRDAQFLKDRLAKAEQHISQLQKEKIPLIASQQQIINLNQQIERLNQRNKSNEQDNSKAKATLQSKTLVLSNLDKELEALRKKVKDLQNQIVQLNADKKAAEEKVGSMDQELRNITAEAIFFRNKLEEAQSYIAQHIDSPSNEQNASSPEVQALRHELAELTQLNQQKQAEIRKANLDKEHLSSSVKQSTSLVENLKRVQGDLQAQLRETQRQKSQLVLDKKNAEQHVRSVEEELKLVTQDSLFFRNKLDEAEQYIFYLESEKNKAQPAVNSDVVPKKLLQHAAAQIDQLTNELTALQSQLNQLQPLAVENQKLAKEREKILQERNIAAQQLSTLEKDQELAKQQINNASNIILNQDNQLQQLKQELAEMQAALNKQRLQYPAPTEEIEGLSQIQKALEQTKKQLNEQRERVARLQYELDQADKIKAQNQILSHENQVILQRLEQLQEQNNAAAQKSKESQKLFFNKIKELQQQKKGLIETEDYLENLQEQKEEKDLVDRQQLDNAENSIRQLQKQIIRYKQAVDQLEVLRPLAKELETLRPQLHEFQACKSKLQALENENRYLNEKLDELQGENKLVLQKANTSQALLVAKINQIEQLQSKIAQQPIDKAENDRVQANTAQGKILQLQQQRDQLVRRLENLQSQIIQSQNENERLRKQSQHSQAKLQILSKKNQQAQERAERAENLLQQTSQQARQYQSLLANKQQQLNTLSAQINTPNTIQRQSDLQKEREDLRDINKSLEDEVERLTKIKEINDERLQSKEAEIKILHEALNRLTNQPKAETKPAQDASFFRSKLLQAEKYIEQIEHLNYNNQQTLNSQNDELKHLASKLAQIQAILASTSKAKENLENELERIRELNQKLNESVNNQISPQQFFDLQSRCKGLQQKIKSQIRENQKLQAATEELKRKYNEQAQEIDSLKREKEMKANEVTFFKEKLFAAQSYITELEESDSPDLANSIKELTLLQEQTNTLKKENQNLKIQNQIKTNKMESLEKSNLQITSEAEFFKKKLLQAETYIKHLQQEMPDEDNIDELKDALNQALINANTYKTKSSDYENRNKDLALMNQQLLNQINELHDQLGQKHADQIKKLQDSLVQLNSRLIQSQAQNKSRQSQKSSDNISQPNDSQFFKEKLLQAQSYIRELQEENGKFETGIATLKSQLQALKEENEQRNQILLERQERIQSLIEQLVEHESQKETLKLKNAQLQQKLEPLTKKIEILDGELVREQQSNNQLIQNLNKDLEVSEEKNQQANQQLQKQASALVQMEEEKAAAEDRARKYQELSNTLQQTLNVLDSISRPSAQQQERIDKLRSQLRQSQQKVLDLTIVNGGKDKVLAQLQIQIDRLHNENMDLCDSLLKLQDQNANLQGNDPQERKQDYQHLQEQINELTKRLQEEKEQKMTLLMSLEQQNRNFTQIFRQHNKLKDKLQQLEEQKEQISSLKEIAEKEYVDTVKELQDKINQLDDSNKQIETQFLQEKLGQAQELILQQQNEIAKLTEDIIQYQVNKQIDDDLLTTKKQEEQRLDEEIKELSNSRQLLEVENRRLQQENQDLIQELSIKLQKKEEELISLEKKNKEQEVENERQRERFDQLQALAQGLKREEELRWQRIELLEEQVSKFMDLSKENEECKQLIAQLQQVALKKQQAQKTIIQLESKLNIKQGQKYQANRRAQQQIGNLEQRLKHKTIQNNELIQLIHPLKQQKQELLIKVEDLQAKAQSLPAILDKLREAEDFISELQIENDTITSTLKDLQVQAPTLRQEVEDLRNQLRKTSQEKQKLMNEINQLNIEMEIMQSDHERLHSKLSSLESAIESKEHQIAQLQESSKDLHRDKPEEDKNANVLERQDQDQLRHLQQQVKALTHELQRANSEKTKLKQLKDSLQEQNSELRSKLDNKQHQDTYEQLRQHLVQADRTNLQLQQIHKHLLLQIQNLTKDKTQLEEQLKSVSPQNSNLQSVQEPKSPIKTIQQAEPESQSKQNRLNSQIEALKEELAEQKYKNELLLESEVENESLRLIKKQLQGKLEDAQLERQRLLAKLKDAEDAIARLLHTQSKLKLEEEQILKEKQELTQNLQEAKQRIIQLEQQHVPQNSNILGQNLKKILDLTNNFNQEVQPQDITQHLQDYPYLNQFINSILYRLRLSTALELQKSIKIKQLTEQLQQAQRQALEGKDYKAANEFLRGQIKQLQQAKSQPGVDKQRYDELIDELVYYQALNKQLEQKLTQITDKFQDQIKRIDGYEEQISVLENSSVSPPEHDLSRQNIELRKKLQSSQRLMQQLKVDSSSSINTKDVFYMEFLKTCLDKVVDLQREVKEVEREIQQVALDSSQRSGSRVEEGRASEENTLQDKLQQLEDKLIKNAQNIREHQQKSDHQLFDLLRELTEVKQLPQINKNKIQQYLTQLENQILREHDQHLNEVSRLRDQLATSQEQSGRSNESLAEFHKATREELLKEINYLHNSIEIYHQESMRRKRNYKRTLESLQRDIQRLSQQQRQTHPPSNRTQEPISEAISQIADKLKYALQKDEEEQQNEKEMGADSLYENNYLLTIDKKDSKQADSGLQQNFGECLQKLHEEKEVQTEQDQKPFLSFILANQNLDKEDIRLLKKKISDMRAKDIEENLQILRTQEKKLEEILQLGSKQNPQQLDNIILTLANNYSRDEISQIFGSEDNDEIINKLNEALCMEDSFYKGENSSTMMKDILERKLKYYEAPTKLSEEVYNHLVNLLSAKKDDEFYDEVELLFRDLYETEAGFEDALRKKDEIYRTHNDRMNQIFNRSSSDGSEEYLTAFERQHNEEPLEMHSERKRKIEEEEEH